MYVVEFDIKCREFTQWNFEIVHQTPSIPK